MTLAISWDQTLLSLVASVALAWMAYVAAARVLRKQEMVRELRQRRDALEQVLALLEGAVTDYLQDSESEYPQREMVELERRTIQAQILFWRDLEMQKALQGLVYPSQHTEAAAKIRGVLQGLERELQQAGG